MKITLGKKLLLVFSVLVFLVLAVQGTLSGLMVMDALKKASASQLDGETAAHSGMLENLVHHTTQDIAVIRAHRDLENYFTSLAFQDQQGMTDSLSNLELFLGRVQAGKPQYTRIQLVTSQAKPVLQMVEGSRSERFDKFDTASLLAKLASAPVVHQVLQVGQDWVLLSAGRLMIDQRMEGVLWFYQPITISLGKMLAEMANNGVSGLLTDTSGQVIMTTPSLPAILLTATSGPPPAGWVVNRATVTDLGWTLLLFMQETGASGVIHRLSVNGVVSALILAAVIGWYARRFITRRLVMIGTAIHDIADGDLLTKVPVAEQPDEIDDISNNVNRLASGLTENIRMLGMRTGSVTAFINEILKVRVSLGADAEGLADSASVIASVNIGLNREIQTIQDHIQQASRNMEEVVTSSSELVESIREIAGSSQLASENVHAMASAAEEMSANMAEVNRNMDRVSSSVTHVASSVEQVTNTLDEVRKRCRHASEKSNQANEYAQSTMVITQRLSGSAQEINNVVQMISNIASQTNMLALNAAIEAAGAGEAGKGFAVVANEVKELARQTADATRMISSKIHEIQGNTREANQAIGHISELVGGINQANEEISTAVEEQAQSVQEISHAMGEVRQAAQTVTRNMGELELAASEVASSAEKAATSTGAIEFSAGAAVAAAEAMNSRTQQARQSAQTIHDGITDIAIVSNTVRDQTDQSLHLVSLMRGSVSHFRSLGDVANNLSQALQATQSGFDIGREALDIRQMKETILDLMGTLERTIHGGQTLDFDHAVRTDGCPLGQWMRQEGKQQFPGSPLLAEMERYHTQLHQTAGEIVKRLQTGKTADATALMERFHQQRQQLFDTMDQLYLAQTV